MAKLHGKAKAAFLARMARGRRKAGGGGGKRKARRRKARKSSGRKKSSHRRNPMMPTALIVNPGRPKMAKKRHHKKSHAKRHHRGRRRRNPSGMLGRILVTGGGGFTGGFLANAVGAKAGGVGGNLLRIGIALLGGWGAGKLSPDFGAAFTSGAFGAIGADAGSRMVGGLPAVATKKTTQKAVAAMAREDDEFMRGLAEEFEAAGIRVEGMGDGGTMLMGGDDENVGDGTDLMGDRMLDAY